MGIFSSNKSSNKPEKTEQYGAILNNSKIEIGIGTKGIIGHFITRTDTI